MVGLYVFFTLEIPHRLLNPEKCVLAGSATVFLACN